MRLFATLAASIVIATAAVAADSRHVITAYGVRLSVPAGWHRLEPTQSGVVDPRMLLVVVTHGATRNPASACQIAAYHVPATGAVVVVVGWRTATSDGGDGRPTGRAPLRMLVRVRRPSFECFDGRGAAATLTIGGKAYQVNVMVGDRASRKLVADALAVVRSFDVVR